MKNENSPWLLVNSRVLRDMREHLHLFYTEEDKNERFFRNKKSITKFNKWLL